MEMKDLNFGDLVGISTGAISDGLIKAVYLSDVKCSIGRMVNVITSNGETHEVDADDVVLVSRARWDEVWQEKDD
jgi:hypothetical protein